LRVGLDSDGVLYKFFSVYNEHLASLGHEVEVESHPEVWDYFTKYGYTAEEFCSHMDDLVDSKKLFWQGELYDDNIPDYIRHMRAAGNTIHIVTNRFSGKQLSSEEATKHFFESVGIEYDSLTFTKDKTSVPTDIFLEDNLKNYDALEAVGVEAYLVDRPYNQNGPGEYRRRVGSFYEFYEKVMLRHYNSERKLQRRSGLPNRNYPRYR